MRTGERVWVGLMAAGFAVAYSLVALHRHWHFDSSWPLASADEIRRLVDERRKAGHAVVFERDGWVVLRR